MQHTTTVEIDASAQQVWEILADVEGWPEWTASVTELARLDEGPLAVGSRARLKQPRLLAAVWHVTDLEPARSFDWFSKCPGVTTSATHHIESGPEGTSRVTLGIDQTGPLAGLARLLFGGLTRRYMEMEAQGLKRRAESAG